MGFWDSIVSSTREASQWVGNALKGVRDMGKQVHEKGHEYLDMGKQFLRDAKPWVEYVPYLGDAHRFGEGATDILGGALDVGRLVTESLGAFGEYLEERI